MVGLKVLDCTLRDGGYCNEWRFGSSNIKRIIDGLAEACVDIIECGFLNHKIKYDSNCSRFSQMTQLAPIIPKQRDGRLFVLMANYGELDVDKLEDRCLSTVDGIRLAFHKKDATGALELCSRIKAKGYEVFVQPMVSLSYTDAEFVELIKSANALAPYAFYIVDSFGVMRKRELLRLFEIASRSLDEDVRIGFHSHNNMQLSYSNAQALVALDSRRELIIDSSIMGMGRGAGNLNTELFLEYINDECCGEYKLPAILRLIDEVITPFYQGNYWGYSLPNYLSAKHNIHPNYAKYLSDKNTLTVAEMDEIFDEIDEEHGVGFDRQYVEALYLAYMKKGEDNEERLNSLKESFSNRKLLVIAPGKSAVEEKERIAVFVKEHNPVVISVNFDFDGVDTDYVFVSNIRRFASLGNVEGDRIICTSNISAPSCFVRVNYSDLINDVSGVTDNAGLMLIKLLIKLGVREVYLAGFDGYSHDVKENYAHEAMQLNYKNEISDALNAGMCEVLGEYSKIISISFLTKERYIKL